MSDRLAGRYRLGDVLGVGGFATVYGAHDEQLDDVVAVKLLARNHSLDPQVRQRFVSEGQILRRIRSPHLVRVYDLAAEGVVHRDLSPGNILIASAPDVGRRVGGIVGGRGGRVVAGRRSGVL